MIECKWTKVTFNNSVCSKLVSDEYSQTHGVIRYYNIDNRVNYISQKQSQFMQ